MTISVLVLNFDYLLPANSSPAIKHRQNPKSNSPANSSPATRQRQNAKPNVTAESPFTQRARIISLNGKSMLLEPLRSGPQFSYICDDFVEAGRWLNKLSHYETDELKAPAEQMKNLKGGDLVDATIETRRNIGFDGISMPTVSTTQFVTGLKKVNEPDSSPKLVCQHYHYMNQLDYIYSDGTLLCTDNESHLVIAEINQSDVERVRSRLESVHFQNLAPRGIHTPQSQQEFIQYKVNQGWVAENKNALADVVSLIEEIHQKAFVLAHRKVSCSMKCIISGDSCSCPVDAGNGNVYYQKYKLASLPATLKDFPQDLGFHLSELPDLKEHGPGKQSEAPLPYAAYARNRKFWDSLRITDNINWREGNSLYNHVSTSLSKALPPIKM